MWHGAKPVICHFVHGKNNMIFGSANECAEYFTLAGHKLFPEAVKRLCAGDGLWQYEENGKVVQVIFDELVTPNGEQEAKNE